MNKNRNLRLAMMAAALLSSINVKPAPAAAVVPSKPANPQPKRDGIGGA